MGRMMFMFKSLSLIVVQRQMAASKSTSPPRSGQHVCLALPPIPMWISPPNTSTQAPSLRASMGQVGCAGGDGIIAGGGGGGHGVGGVGTMGGVTTGGLGTQGGGITTGGLGTKGGETIGGVGMIGGDTTGGVGVIGG